MKKLFFVFFVLTITASASVLTFDNWSNSSSSSIWSSSCTVGGSSGSCLSQGQFANNSGWGQNSYSQDGPNVQAGSEAHFAWANGLSSSASLWSPGFQASSYYNLTAFGTSDLYSGFLSNGLSSLVWQAQYNTAGSVENGGVSTSSVFEGVNILASNWFQNSSGHQWGDWGSSGWDNSTGSGLFQSGGYDNSQTGSSSGSYMFVSELSFQPQQPAQSPVLSYGVLTASIDTGASDASGVPEPASNLSVGIGLLYLFWLSFKHKKHRG